MNKKGFTIIEIVVSVAVIAIMGSISFPIAKTLIKYNYQNECNSIAYKIRDALKVCMLDHSAICSSRISPVKCKTMDKSVENENRNNITTAEFLHFYILATEDIEDDDYIMVYKSESRIDTIPILEEGGVGETEVSFRLMGYLKVQLNFEVYDALPGEKDYAYLKSFIVTYRDEYTCKVTM